MHDYRLTDQSIPAYFRVTGLIYEACCDLKQIAKISHTQYRIFGFIGTISIRKSEQVQRNSVNRSKCHSSVDNYVSIGGSNTFTITEPVLRSTNLKRQVPESEPTDVESITK